MKRHMFQPVLIISIARFEYQAISLGTPRQQITAALKYGYLPWLANRCNKGNTMAGGSAPCLQVLSLHTAVRAGC